MSYNDIQINGQDVKGHKYVGSCSNLTDIDLKANPDVSITIDEDCILRVRMFEEGGALTTVSIYVNGTLIDTMDSGTSAERIVYQNAYPVKKGDTVRFVSSDVVTFLHIYYRMIYYR